jgi:lactate dehydrogenase-like 2-hydroxyacid dehydrogenase
MALFPALEMISVCGVGYDGIDVAAAKKRGIMVTHTPECFERRCGRFGLGFVVVCGTQNSSSRSFHAQRRLA